MVTFILYLRIVRGMVSQNAMVGGQAVIEGVMMRGKKHVVTAVRNKGKILFREDTIKKRPAWCEIFFIRGIVNLWEMLVLGVKTLNWSASLSEEGEEELSSAALISTFAVSFLFAIVLFVALPYGLTYFFGLTEVGQPVWFNIVDGLIKIGIFVLYVYLIGLMKDIYRVFQYHGAEHKAVHCFEAKKQLTVANTKPFSTLHPRCGTSFIFLVMIVAILLFSFIPLLAQWLFPGLHVVHWGVRRGILFVMRIMLLPVVAGISYEVLRYSAKQQGNRFWKALSQPGMWIQKLTTKEPTARQIEVSLAALKKVVAMEKLA